MEEQVPFLPVANCPSRFDLSFKRHYRRVSPLGSHSCKREVIFLFSFIGSGPSLSSWPFLHGKSIGLRCCKCKPRSLLQPECIKARKRIESEHRQFQKRYKNHPKLVRCDVLGTILAIEYRVGERFLPSSVKNKTPRIFSNRRIFLRPLGNVLYLLPPYCITSEKLQKIYSAIAITLEEWHEKGFCFI